MSSHALRDVSFEVPEGEFFGIVGRNGSGKSTLLKCLAGIYRIDEGDMRVRGRISTFIELGVGFNPDLAARDNIIINAIMLGLVAERGAPAAWSPFSTSPSCTSSPSSSSRTTRRACTCAWPSR